VRGAAVAARAKIKGFHHRGHRGRGVLKPSGERIQRLRGRPKCIIRIRNSRCSLCPPWFIFTVALHQMRIVFLLERNYAFR
jgi:hypothetical protein